MTHHIIAQNYRTLMLVTSHLITEVINTVYTVSFQPILLIKFYLIFGKKFKNKKKVDRHQPTTTYFLMQCMKFMPFAHPEKLCDRQSFTSHLV